MIILIRRINCIGKFDTSRLFVKILKFNFLYMSMDAYWFLHSGFNCNLGLFSAELS